MSGENYAPVPLHPGKSPLYPGWVLESAWTTWRSEKSFAPARVGTPNLPFRIQYTDYATWFKIAAIAQLLNWKSYAL